MLHRMKRKEKHVEKGELRRFRHLILKQRGPHFVWFFSLQLPLLFPARDAEFISLVSFRLGRDHH